MPFQPFADPGNLQSSCGGTTSSHIPRQSCQHFTITNVTEPPAPRPVGVRFHQLLDYLDMCLPRIIRSRLSRVRPWCVMCPAYDFRLVQYAKDVTAGHTYDRHIAELLSPYPEYTPNFTDGSFVQGWAGCAFVHEEQIFSYRLQTFNSVCAAALHDLLPSASFNLLTASAHTHYVISRVSMGTHRIIRSVWGFHSKDAMSTVIRRILLDTWPQRAAGNEATDAAAKEAAMPRHLTSDRA
jgi:hypothetical protein